MYNIPVCQLSSFTCITSCRTLLARPICNGVGSKYVFLYVYAIIETYAAN